MAAYSLNEIANATGGRLQGDQGIIIREILTDSRSATLASASLFFAIPGANHNGHRFIVELYARNVRSFVVSETVDTDLYPGANFIYVTDTLQAFQKLATWHRNRFTGHVTAITGSNGKTIVKEWLFHLLSDKYNITRSPKSYNSQLGVPLSLWLLDENTELGIFEAGISRTGEMEKLQKMIQPDTGIFTNIGEAHSENFLNNDEKIAEKLKLFHKCRTVIYCYDHAAIRNAIQNNPEMALVKQFTWSFEGKGDVNIQEITKEDHSIFIRLSGPTGQFSFTIPFADDASVENALHCATYMILSETAKEKIIEGMTGLPPVAMRLEQKTAVNNCTLINDSYNSDLNSLSIALDVLRHQLQHDNKTLILSDILQSGHKQTDLYKKVASLVREKGVTRIIGIGNNIREQAPMFSIPGRFYQSTQDFLDNFNPEEFRDEAILLKGSRLYEFERIAALFEQKKHTTRIEINLNALAHNLNYFRSLLKPTTKTMVMVKALSYGSGRHEVAGILQFQRADYLGVAIADEGVSLRKAGINLPVMVMNPEAESFDNMIQHRLEPEIYSEGMLSLFHKAVTRNQESQYPVHIKIDTGMHRLGFLKEQVHDLCNSLHSYRNIRISSVFSHLAGSDEPQYDDFTREQIALFTETSEKIIHSLGYPVMRHILNTSGIERFPEAQFDMVRLGIGLYGISSTDPNRLMNVSTLKSTILQIKPVDKGETVGYSRKGRPLKRSLIAIIPIGYADGLNRRAGNGILSFLVNGKAAPTVGNICMDMTMIDVTGIPAEEGDEVVIFGEGNPISGIAGKLGTIPYEILTGVSERVKRVYFYE